MTKLPLTTRLRDCASQENCDSIEYDLMQEAAVELTKMAEFNQELMEQNARQMLKASIHGIDKAQVIRDMFKYGEDCHFNINCSNFEESYIRPVLKVKENDSDK